MAASRKLRFMVFPICRAHKECQPGIAGPTSGRSVLMREGERGRGKNRACPNGPGGWKNQRALNSHSPQWLLRQEPLPDWRQRKTRHSNRCSHCLQRDQTDQAVSLRRVGWQPRPQRRRTPTHGRCRAWARPASPRVGRAAARLPANGGKSTGFGCPSKHCWRFGSRQEVGKR